MQILCEVLHFAGGETAGGNTPDVCDLVILQRRRDRALALTFRQVEPGAIFFCHAELGLEFDTEPLLLVVFCRDLIGFPTLFQQANCRFGQDGSRRCV